MDHTCAPALKHQLLWYKPDRSVAIGSGGGMLSLGYTDVASTAMGKAGVGSFTPAMDAKLDTVCKGAGILTKSRALSLGKRDVGGVYEVRVPHASCLMPHASCLMPHASWL